MDKKAAVISILILIASVSALSTGVITGANYSDAINRMAVSGKSFFDSAPKSEQEIVDRCSNLDLKDTCYCLSNNVGKIYSYKSNELHSSDFEFLMNSGGSCSDWSGFYQDLAEKLNFKSNAIFISDSKDDGKKININAHEFVIIYDNNIDGYCILDGAQINYQELQWPQK